MEETQKKLEAEKEEWKWYKYSSQVWDSLTINEKNKN